MVDNDPAPVREWLPAMAKALGAKPPPHVPRWLDRIVGVTNHTVLVRKDGTELNIADSGAPIRDKKGEIIGIVLVFRDITMERKTQEASSFMGFRGG